MLSLDEARSCVAAAVHPLEAARAPLAEALGSVLREDVRAPGDIPAFDRSAMDGYALGAGDGPYRLRGETRPGQRASIHLDADECVRIFTGAEVPASAVRVLRQEDASVDAGEWVSATSAAAGPDFIRRRGEDARAGDKLLEAGLRLWAAELALLASVGIAEPLVSPPCRVVHFATGDELVAPDAEPGPGGVRDANSTLVAAFVRTQWGVMAHQERVCDDAGVLASRAEAALVGGADLLLISGGASVGSYDYGHETLRRLGFTPQFQGIRARPGRPLAFATRGRIAAFLLPGNPLSHLAMLHTVVRVAIDSLAGAPSALPVLNAGLAADLDVGRSDVEALLPGRLILDRGTPIVTPLRWMSSGDITGVGGINALIRCSPGEPSPLRMGTRLPCILLHV